ncbi:LacI family DNA-binding transcriptional regulator [Streptomyces sp. NBC_00576]|uniref:LacI family DNA-binding transcriptional regulator n=1 Tax=Streptomyces sp. NBC_00576 TaxID=2903665 RepID=UPI002E7FFBB6|nr:LacI family DNA-binding transcriptional regulator [Streptomyces sp. NBC_00576]WUB69323.1 LacI family transcriptional regulator [Streptomyces sp. NBC_00576]
MRIIDVAAAAEVSRATVTNALNGTGRMNAATRVRVRAIAAELGYRTPVRTLALGVTAFPGVPWNFLEIAYYRAAVGAAMAAAHRHGFGLTVLPAGATGWESVSADGALILDPSGDDPLAIGAARAGIPVTFLGRPSASRGSWIDNYHDVSTKAVLDHLAGQGAHRITLIASSATDHYTRSCVAAYRAWCRAHGRPERVVDWEPGEDPAEIALAGRPDAVYAIYESIGFLLLDAARRHGLRIPDDLLIACFSEDPAYATADPPVTTVCHRATTGGRLAVDALVTRLQTGVQLPSVLVPARLAVRRSALPGPEIGNEGPPFVDVVQRERDNHDRLDAAGDRDEQLTRHEGNHTVDRAFGSK